MKVLMYSAFPVDATCTSIIETLVHIRLIARSTSWSLVTYLSLTKTGDRPRLFQDFRDY